MSRDSAGGPPSFAWPRWPPLSRLASVTHAPVPAEVVELAGVIDDVRRSEKLPVSAVRTALVAADLNFFVVSNTPELHQKMGKDRSAFRDALLGLAFALLDFKPRRGPKRPISDAVETLRTFAPFTKPIFAIPGNEEAEGSVKAEWSKPVDQLSEEQHAALAALKRILQSPGRPLEPDHHMYYRGVEMILRELKTGPPPTPEERVGWGLHLVNVARPLNGPSHRPRDEAENFVIYELAAYARRHTGSPKRLGGVPLDRQCCAVFNSVFRSGTSYETYRQRRAKLDRERRF